MTQADLAAKHWTNMACVDDGAGGAGQACADEDVPLKHLTITKVATEQSFTAVGNILHYTIVATNDGGTDLAAVTVSDSLVSDLSCAPSNGSALAQGCVDDVHGDAHGDAGGPRCQALGQHGLRR